MSSDPSMGRRDSKCGAGRSAFACLLYLGFAIAAAARADDLHADAVRTQANTARVAVLAADPQADALLAAAAASANRLPSTTAGALEIRLHVLRSRMLRLLPEDDAVLAGGSGGPRATAEAEAPPSTPSTPAGDALDALARDLERLEAEAAVRAEDGPRAWSLLYLARLARVRGDRAAARGLSDRLLLLPEADATWEPQVLAEAFREREGLASEESGEGLGGLRRAQLILERVRTRVDAETHLARARPIHERLAGRLLDEARARPSDAQARMYEALDALEDLKRAELRAYFGDPCLAGLERTTPERLPGALLVYPVLLEDRVELIVGRDGTLSLVAVPISPAALQAEARKLRGALQDPTSPRFRAHAARLYEALIRPLSSTGERAFDAEHRASTTLVFVPAGPLREIPLAALFDERSGEFLVEQVAIATLPSLRILPPRALDRRRTQLLAVGLTEAVEDFPALAWVERELDAVTHRFPSTRRVDASFTQEGFAAALDERPFDIVHVASHGRFDARASESFLLARDGRITLPELADLIGRTRHRTRRPLELLVLSACETAIGDERAVLGLAGVAVQAGARSAVASLWKVHDEATMELFARFYRELGRPGVTRAEALRRAQRALIGEQRFRHPIFWSAFLLVNGWL